MENHRKIIEMVAKLVQDPNAAKKIRKRQEAIRAAIAQARKN